MKQSLKSSIKLFLFKDQLKLYVALVALKLKIKLPEKYNTLFQKCINFVRVSELGVNFERAEKDLIKATLTINNRTITVFLRSNSSDLHVLESVLLQNEYKPAVEYLLESKNQFVNQIVDAGGNIGLTSIYFHCFFPDAHYTIIEPDASNFLLLKKNTEANGFKHKLLLKNALWISNEPLIIDDSFRDGKEWSLTVGSEKTSIETERKTGLTGITLQEIWTKNNKAAIDLLKIDIEGAERFLFADREFLATISASVGHLVIEIHDEFNIRGTINSEMKEMKFTKDEYADITLYAKQFK